MLSRIIELSLRHRGAVIAAWLVIAIAGLLSFRTLPLDAFPDTTAPQVQVNTVAEALSPTEVERQLTFPLEQALTNLPGVTDVRSLSKFGLSQITLQFTDETDIWFARQQVSERLATVQLPNGIERPVLGPVASGLGEVFHYIVSGERSLEELRTIHDWTIAPQLRTVPGVAEVNAWGGAEQQWHVVVDPRRLQQFGLTLGDLYGAIESNNANVGGGVVEQGGSASLVVGVGRLPSGEALGDITIVARDGVPVRVRDVARVEVGREIRRGAVTANGKGEVVLGLAFARLGESGYEVTEALAAKLADVAKSLPEGVKAEAVYERTTLVDEVLSTVRTNLFEGALLVVAVLFVFLGSWRAGLIVAMAIPLSLLFAGNLMARFGIAGTLMSLGAIDFGLLVDSSVILVENAERRLGLDGGQRSTIEVVRDATLEVRKPSLFGELIILVVYLPLLALEGVEGKLFRPMAVTVIFALLGSILLSMTLVPVLASYGLGKHRTREPRFLRALQRIYRPVVDFAIARPLRVVGVAVAVLVLAALGAANLGSEFIPRLSEGSIVINTVRLAEVSLEESVRYGQRIEAVLLERFPDEVETVWTRTGSAELATDPMGIELSDVFVQLTPRERWKRATTQPELVAEMEAELADLPGMNMAFLQPIELRTNEMIAGSRTDLAIQIFGDDLDLLAAKAREVQALVEGIEGAADVSVEALTGQPVIEVAVDRASAARFGIPARDILDVVEAVGTRKAGEILDGDRRVPVAVRLDDPWRTEPERLGEVVVAAPGGARVPLAQLTKLVHTSGPSTVNRSFGKRRVVVQANVRGRDLGSFVAEVQRRIDAGISLPAGSWVRYGGQFEHLERARDRLLVVVPAALALIVGLLWFTYRRWLDCIRVCTGVPFAWVGGVAALMLRDLPFSIAAAVGFVILSGVAVLDDMVLVSRMRQLQKSGMPLHDSIREAAASRLRPVLITSAVATLGFLPMALSTGIGAEVQRPLATVVIGGVLSATLLTLVVLPAVSVLLAPKAAAANVAPQPGGAV